MAFNKKIKLDSNGDAITIGGINKKTKKANPKSVEGYYLGFRNVETDLGTSKLHFFQTEDGNVAVWGKTDMNNQLSDNDLGVMTRITHTGSKPSGKGKNPMITYDVEVDKENSIEVDGTALQLGSDQDAGEEEAPSDEPYDEGEPEEEEAPVAEEAPPSRPRAPQRAAQPPSSAQQAKVQKLLAGSRQQARK